ncbi:phytanoyl-CoA dioxygenase family protein [Halohasta salina]|uniref:phytanoyl-CoA dioxygenase family protein n=1 Tax=Halohasta salina TaxID=2961621 RepID=UPI0020A55AC4|nr:phytanoyl-CoA dioxygenase family protein [Halohasta salina]
MSLIKDGANYVRNIEQVDAADKKIGRRLFNNTNGVINNTVGRTKIAKARLLSDYKTNTSSQVRQLRSEGYVSLGKIADDEKISSIQQQYDELLDSEHSYALREYDGDVYSRSVTKIHQRIPELGDLLTDEIKDIVRDYYGSYTSVKTLHAWRNYHASQEVLEETEIYSDSWHCDGILTDVVKLFINLSDVTEETGPFHVLPRDKSRELIDQGYERNREEMPDEVVDEEHVKRAIGPAGTAMLCTTWNCFHRAGHIAEGNTRDMIQFQFVPSSGPLSDDPAEWLKDVQIHPGERRRSQ